MSRENLSEYTFHYFILYKNMKKELKMEQKGTVWSKTVFNHHHHTTYLIHYSYLNTFVFLGLRFMLAAYCYGDPGYCVSYNSKRRLVHKYIDTSINVGLMLSSANHSWLSTTSTTTSLHNTTTTTWIVFEITLLCFKLRFWVL